MKDWIQDFSQDMEFAADEQVIQNLDTSGKAAYSRTLLRFSKPELLKQVWVNFIDNAVKFANRCGTVRMDISQSGDTTTVTIADTGAEIPEDSLNYVFQKFYQVDKSRATQGNGIGLSVAKAIVELHSGRITASSGGGETIFPVELPMRKHSF